MNLTQNHRESLLNELSKAEKDVEQNENLISNEAKDKNGLGEWFEISHYLAQERVKLIKSAIAANEIDY